MTGRVERIEIKKIPDKETLEAFIGGINGQQSVVFNQESGEFEWVKPRPDSNLGKPKTELGRRLTRL